MAGALKLGWNALIGKTLKKAKKARKNVRKMHPLDYSKNLEAKKNVRRAKDTQNLVRGTALLGGGGGAYLATKNKEEDSIIPSDY